MLRPRPPSPTPPCPWPESVPKAATSTSSRLSRRATDTRRRVRSTSPRTGLRRPSASMRPVRRPSPMARSISSMRSRPSVMVIRPVNPSSGRAPARISSARTSRSRSTRRQRSGSIGSSGSTSARCSSCAASCSWPAEAVSPGPVAGVTPTSPPRSSASSTRERSVPAILGRSPPRVTTRSAARSLSPTRPSKSLIRSSSPAIPDRTAQPVGRDLQPRQLEQRQDRRGVLALRVDRGGKAPLGQRQGHRAVDVDLVRPSSLRSVNG